MGKEKIEVLVDAGKATAAPPLGPALGPLGVNIGKIVDEINNKTKELSGLKVPVTVIVDTETKNYEIKIGTPPVSALIKKELNIEKGSGKAGIMRVGDLTMEQVKKIAKAKFGSDDDVYTSQVIGTAKSMGITIGKGPLTKEEIKAIEKSREKAATAAPAESKSTPEAAVEKETKKPAEKKK
jgi:large subunit ribosomal protein L11